MPTLRNIVVAFSLTFGFLLWSSAAQAQCTLPYQLTNGQVADASQVMANYNALITCLAAGGSANAVQINNGSGGLAGVGPLTDGQVVIGSTGNAPQGAALTAGSGISITNGAGSVTIAASGGGGGSSWTVVTANTTAAPGGMYLADTSAGPFTITLPTSGVVQIADAKGSFGTNNLTIAAASGQTLSGLTYTGAASIALNAPGNNATVLCGTNTANVQQVAQGVWGQTVASGAASVAWTGLPSNVIWTFNTMNAMSSSAANYYFRVGTGTAPTYISTGYFTELVTSTGTAFYTGQSSGYLTNNASIHMTSATPISYRIYTAPSAGQTTWSGFFGYGPYMTVGGTTAQSAPVTAIQFAPSAGTISGTFSLAWDKLNV